MTIEDLVTKLVNQCAPDLEVPAFARDVYDLIDRVRAESTHPQVLMLGHELQAVHGLLDEFEVPHGEEHEGADVGRSYSLVERVQALHRILDARAAEQWKRRELVWAAVLDEEIQSAKASRHTLELFLSEKLQLGLDDAGVE